VYKKWKEGRTRGVAKGELGFKPMAVSKGCIVGPSYFVGERAKGGTRKKVKKRKGNQNERSWKRMQKKKRQDRYGWWGGSWT